MGESGSAGGERGVRASDLAALEHELTSALGGRGRAVFVTGPAGSGKSALLRAFAEQASRRGVRVASGACGTGKGPGDVWARLAARSARGGKIRRVATSVLPDWAPVIPVVGKLVSAVLATALALRGGSGAEEEEKRPSTSVGSLRALLAGAGAPAVIVLDDLDRGGAEDLAGAAALVHRLPKERRLFVAAFGSRPDAEAGARDVMLEADRLGCAARLRLEARGRGAAGVGSLAAVPPPDRELLARVAGAGVFRAAELAALSGVSELELEDRLAALVRAGVLEYRGTEDADGDVTSIYAFASPELAAALAGGA